MNRQAIESPREGTKARETPALHQHLLFFDREAEVLARCGQQVTQYFGDVQMNVPVLPSGGALYFPSRPSGSPQPVIDLLLASAVAR